MCACCWAATRCSAALDRLQCSSFVASFTSTTCKAPAAAWRRGERQERGEQQPGSANGISFLTRARKRHWRQTHAARPSEYAPRRAKMVVIISSVKTRWTSASSASSWGRAGGGEHERRRTACRAACSAHGAARTTRRCADRHGAHTTAAPARGSTRKRTQSGSANPGLRAPQATAGRAHADHLPAAPRSGGLTSLSYGCLGGLRLMPYSASQGRGGARRCWKPGSPGVATATGITSAVIGKLVHTGSNRLAPGATLYTPQQEGGVQRSGAAPAPALAAPLPALGRID